MTDAELETLARETAEKSIMKLLNPTERLDHSAIIQYWIMRDSKEISPIILSALRRVRESEKEK